MKSIQIQLLQFHNVINEDLTDMSIFFRFQHKGRDIDTVTRRHVRMPLALEQLHKLAKEHAASLTAMASAFRSKPYADLSAAPSCVCDENPA